MKGQKRRTLKVTWKNFSAVLEVLHVLCILYTAIIIIIPQFYCIYFLRNMSWRLFVPCPWPLVSIAIYRVFTLNLNHLASSSHPILSCFSSCRIDLLRPLMQQKWGTFLKSRVMAHSLPTPSNPAECVHFLSHFQFRPFLHITISVMFTTTYDKK